VTAVGDPVWAGAIPPGYPAEAHNGAGSNTVTLSRPKGESNREHKADLPTGGVLSTRPGKRMTAMLLLGRLGDDEDPILGVGSGETHRTWPDMVGQVLGRPLPGVEDAHMIGTSRAAAQIQGYRG
jgi:hypothetical protein